MQKEQMKNITTSNTYSSADFYLTAYLLCSGLELLKAERVGYNRVVFLLKDSPQREQFIQDFYGHRAKVDPLSYKDSISNLKGLIHGIQA